MFSRKRIKLFTHFKFLLIYPFIFSAFCGCAGVQYSDHVSTNTITIPGEKIKTRVLARAEEWRNSGVILKKDHKYHVKARGRWSAGGICGWTGPDGRGCSSLCMEYIKGWSGSTLMGKIGEFGKPFGVMEDYEFEADEDGILYLRINDPEGFCGDNGGYVDAEISLLISSQMFTKNIPSTSIALNKKGVKKRLPSQNSSNSWAIIIGISQYQHSSKNGLTNLIFADDDAKTFARTLLKLGWSESHIKLITNEDATQRNIMIQLESWLTKAGPEDQIILFWASHGFPDPEDPEKVYFACYDTDINIPATGYRMDRVRTVLEERNAKNVIVLADTCHAGKLITRGDRGISILPNIKNQNVPKGWVFMVGADTDRQAVEHSSWSNGAFTHSLIKGLTGKADGFQSAGAKDGVVSMGELKAYMNTAMPDETQRVLGVAKRPVITTSTGDPDIWNLTLQVE